MTTIHTERQKTWHFPVTKHDSVLRSREGWLIEPDVMLPGLKIWDNGNTIDIGIKLPGIKRDQVEIRGDHPWVISSTKNPISQEEVIHVIMPKEKASWAGERRN